MSTPGDLLGALGREARARFGNGKGAGAEARVYRGRSVEELIPKIQRELGPDAIVVRRREGLTGGVLGFFQHAWVEIEAMPGTPRLDVYDEAHPAEPMPADAPPHPAAGPAPPRPPEPQAPPTAPSARPVAARYEPAPAPGPLYASARTPSQAPPPPSYAPAVAAAAPPIEAAPAQARAEDPFEQPGGSAYVTAHLAALARAGSETVPRPPLIAEPPSLPPLEPARHERRPLHFQELISEAPPRPLAPTAAPAPAPDWTAGVPFERRTVRPGSHQRARAGVEKGLARYGIGEELTAELIDAAMAHALPLAPRSGLAAAVRATLAQRIPVAPPLALSGASIVLVGAGGAGKTTCCAALLEAYRSHSTLPAAFATIVREGEAGELRLLMSPQLLKPTPLDSPRALRALRRARAEGLAVLDTPRLSPADRTGVRRLGRLLGELQPERVLLALPATLGRTAASQLLEALAPLKANALVVTHADETDQIGVAVEAACRFDLAPEFMLEHARAGGWRLRRLDPVALAAMVLP